MGLISWLNFTDALRMKPGKRVHERYVDIADMVTRAGSERIEKQFQICNPGDVVLYRQVHGLLILAVTENNDQSRFSPA